MSINEFKTAFENYLLRFYMIKNVEDISEVDKTAINSLANKKYRTQAWNYGYSPKYKLRSSLKVEGGHADIQLKVVNGLIANATIEGDHEKIKELRRVLLKIIGLPHHPALLDPYIRELIKSETDRKLFNKVLF
jgi:lipoate-protein ligase A